MGHLIVFEGADGAGKSTQLKLAAEYLQSRGFEVVHTREPGGTPMAEDIREVMLSPREEAVDDDAEMLLAFAARQQHIVSRIKPAIDEGKIVLCDRFIPSSFAYQVRGKGAEESLFHTLEAKALSSLGSNIKYLMFTMTPEESQNRVENRGNKDRMEQEGDAFFQRVKAGYDEFLRNQISNDPSSIDAIDANGSIEEVSDRIIKVLNKTLGLGQARRSQFNGPRFELNP